MRAVQEGGGIVLDGEDKRWKLIIIRKSSAVPSNLPDVLS